MPSPRAPRPRPPPRASPSAGVAGFLGRGAGAPEARGARGEPLGGREGGWPARRSEPPAGSYTAKLYGDENLRHKKIGEEATELVMASLRGDKDAVAEEAADLLYHALVLLQSHGVGLREVADKLRGREGRRRNPA